MVIHAIEARAGDGSERQARPSIGNITVTGPAVKVSGEYLGLVAETLGQLY